MVRVTVNQSINKYFYLYATNSTGAPITYSYDLSRFQLYLGSSKSNRFSSFIPNRGSKSFSSCHSNKPEVGVKFRCSTFNYFNLSVQRVKTWYPCLYYEKSETKLYEKNEIQISINK